MGKKRIPGEPYYTNHGKKFDDELKMLWARGDATAQMAEILNGHYGLSLSKNAVIGYRNRMQLPERGSPIIRDSNRVRLPAPPPRRQRLSFKPVQPMLHGEWQQWFNELPLSRRRDIAVIGHKALCAALKNSSGMWNCNCGASLPPGRPRQKLAEPIATGPVTVAEIKTLLAEEIRGSGLPDARPPEPPDEPPPDQADGADDPDLGDFGLGDDEPEDDDPQDDDQGGGGDDTSVDIEEDEVEYASASARKTPLFDDAELCCYPKKGVGSAIRYCDKPVTTRRSPYCDEHRKVAYTRTRQPGEPSPDAEHVPIERRLLQNSANGRWS